MEELDREIEALSEKIIGKPKEPRFQNKGLSLSVRILSDFIGITLVSVGIGVLTDKVFDIKPFGVIGFLILGFLSSCRSIYQDIKCFDKDCAGREK